MKGFDFKGTSSELSMLVGSSSSNQNDMEGDKPKLEDFLGGNSFPDSNQNLPPGCNSMAGAYDSTADYMFSNCSLQLPPAASTASASDGADGRVMVANGGVSNNTNNSIGLSMIKTWLRNQPAPPQQDGRVDDMVGMGAAGCGATSSTVNAGAPLGNNAQSLSLSMSTGSQSSPSLPLLAANGGGGGGGGGESSSSADNKQKIIDGGGSGLDAQSGAIEAVPRKSIDTFGQRTSIYRGVTRFRHAQALYMRNPICLLIPLHRVISVPVTCIYPRIQVSLILGETAHQSCHHDQFGFSSKPWNSL